MRGKRAFSAATMRRGVVDRQRGLRDVGERVGGSRTASRADVRDRFDEVDAAVALAHRALDLGVPGVADHHDLAALRRASCATSTCTLVTSGQVASNTVRPRASASARTALRHAVRARRSTVLPAGTSSSSSTNTAPLRLQVVDDELVVHDLVAHVDRRAVLRERLLDDRDRAVDAGAEAARIGEQDVHQRLLSGRAASAPRAPLAEAVEDQQRRADGDRAVGDVERRPRPARVVEQQEVDDLAEREAIAEVAERAAQDQREAGAEQRGCRRAAAATTITTAAATAIAAKNQRCQPAAVGEEAERRAGVVRRAPG